MTSSKHTRTPRASSSSAKVPPRPQIPDMSSTSLTGTSSSSPSLVPHSTPEQMMHPYRGTPTLIPGSDAPKHERPKLARSIHNTSAETHVPVRRQKAIESAIRRDEIELAKLKAMRLRSVQNEARIRQLLRDLDEIYEDLSSDGKDVEKDHHRDNLDEKSGKRGIGSGSGPSAGLRKPSGGQSS